MYHDARRSHGNSAHMDKVTELDGVVEESAGLEEEEVISRVLLLPLGQHCHLRDIREDTGSLIEHTPVYGCHGSSPWLGRENAL